MFRSILAYDGTDFAGSQVQPNRRTVQGVLEESLARIAGRPVHAVFAGRTDRGVHASGQVVAFGLGAWRGTDSELERALQSLLPRDLVARDVRRTNDAFNPRFDAVWREYRYWIAPEASDPFLQRFAWVTKADVAMTRVAAGTDVLKGNHDFATFVSGGEGVPWSGRAQRHRGTVRSILNCECRELTVNPGPNADSLTRILEIRVVADGFLPRMVRNMVGALYEVGQGRRDPAWIGEILNAKDRRRGPVAAPAHGLTLWRIGFAGESPEIWNEHSPLQTGARLKEQSDGTADLVAKIG